MTDKQNRFVQEYLIDLNATQAAIRAGYSPKTANEQGSRLLANVSVQAAIDTEMAKRSKRTGVNQDRVIRELARIGFAKLTDIVDGDGRIKEDASDDDLAALEVIKVKTSDTDTGMSEEREVRVGSKLKALELLGKHLGMFTDKSQLEVSGDVDLTFNMDYGDGDSNEGSSE